VPSLGQKRRKSTPPETDARGKKEDVVGEGRDREREKTTTGGGI